MFVRCREAGVEAGRRAAERVGDYGFGGVIIAWDQVVLSRWTFWAINGQK